MSSLPPVPPVPPPYHHSARSRFHHNLCANLEATSERAQSLTSQMKPTTLLPGKGTSTGMPQATLHLAQSPISEPQEYSATGTQLLTAPTGGRVQLSGQRKTSQMSDSTWQHRQVAAALRWPPPTGHTLLAFESVAAQKSVPADVTEEKEDDDGTEATKPAVAHNRLQGKQQLEQEQAQASRERRQQQEQPEEGGKDQRRRHRLRPATAVKASNNKEDQEEEEEAHKVQASTTKWSLENCAKEDEGEEGDAARVRVTRSWQPAVSVSLGRSLATLDGASAAVCTTPLGAVAVEAKECGQVRQLTVNSAKGSNGTSRKASSPTLPSLSSPLAREPLKATTYLPSVHLNTRKRHDRHDRQADRRATQQPSNGHLHAHPSHHHSPLLTCSASSPSLTLPVCRRPHVYSPLSSLSSSLSSATRHCPSLRAPSPLSASTRRSSSKTATPSVLRAKLFRHSASSRKEEEGSESLGEATQRLLPSEPPSRASSSEGDHAVGSSPGSPLPLPPAASSSKHAPATGGFTVSWTELRNKLIRIQRKTATASEQQRRKYHAHNRKRTWALSLPTSTGASSVGSSSAIGHHKHQRRFTINRSLLTEFRSRFRRQALGSNRSLSPTASPSSSSSSPLFYFDNPVVNSPTAVQNSTAYNSGSNYSYSYYNFFYYPSRDQQQGPADIPTLVSGQPSDLATIPNTKEASSVRSAPVNPPRPVYPGFSRRSVSSGACTADQCLGYHRLHGHPSPSLSSLLSVSASQPTGTANCCKQHLQLANALVQPDPERNQLLPTSVSADAVNTHSSSASAQYLRRSGLLGHPAHRHHYCHRHNHRNSLCTSLLAAEDTEAATGHCTLDSCTSPLTLPTSASFLGQHPRSPSSSEVVSPPNPCLSTIMEILPLLLLLTMGVIISTTCAKYTFHSSPSGQAHSSASVSSAYHHHYGGQQHFESTLPDKASSKQDSSAEQISGANGRPDPPYLMMMQNDDEYSSHSATANSPADSSVEGFDASGSSGVVEESPKKSVASTRSFHGQPLHQQGAGVQSGMHQSQPQPVHQQPHHKDPKIVQLAQQYSAMKLHWLSNTSVTCNDGTRAGFYLRHNPSSKRWLIFLEGGWYCMSKSTCDQRWSKMREYMTSFRWAPYRTFNGILSTSPTINPYWWDANHVFIPYCSSDIWSGNSAASRHEMAFLGSRIIDEVFKELIHSPVYQFTDAKFVLLAGSSAGAAGVMINLDRVAQTVAESGSKADVRGLADSGWILENDYLDNMATNGKGGHKGGGAVSAHPKTHSPPCTDVVNCSPMDGIRGAFKLWNSRVPTSCEANYPTEPWRCFFGYRLYPTLQTPLFVVQYQYDEFQMHVDGMTHGSRSWSEHERVRYIRSLSEAIRHTLTNVSAVFAPACMAHMVLANPHWTKVAIKGVTLPEALHCWEETPNQSALQQAPRSRFDHTGGTFSSLFHYSPAAYQQQFGNQMLQQQQKLAAAAAAASSHLEHHSKANLNAYYKSPSYYQPPGAASQSAKSVFSMYPYGMPVVTSGSPSNGASPSGNSGTDLNVDMTENGGDEDELSQFYSNSGAMHFSYANSPSSSSSSSSSSLASSAAALKKSGSSNNFYNLQDDMMVNDDPRVSEGGSKSSSSSSATTSVNERQAKSGASVEGKSGDENSIASMASGRTSPPSSPPSSNSSSSSSGTGHSGNSNRKQDKKRRKRKRRKHLHRRFQQQQQQQHSSGGSSTGGGPGNSLPGGYKPKRTSPVEDNQIKLSPGASPALFQNDGIPPVVVSSSRSKKHRPRMSNPYDPWSLSGGDEAASEGAYPPTLPKCHYRLIDEHHYPRTNIFGCPFQRD